MNYIRLAFTLIVSYAMAAMLSSHVSMDLALTDWTNLWTYFWWAVALPVSFGIFALMIISALGVVSFVRNL